MLDLRGYILLPTSGSNDEDETVVSNYEMAELRRSILALAQCRIAVALEQVHNGQHIIFLADFGNHGAFALEALREIENLLTPFEHPLSGQMKAHLFAFDDESGITVEVRLGDPSAPLD